MFRYERPQKGRLRQFHQIDVELLGVPEAMGDVEIIALGAEVLKALGVNEAVKLELNTLGDSESRAAYRDSLVEYFNAHLADLSEDSRTRLEKNPLRILDSKDEGDRHVVAGAPKMSEYLNASSHAFFASVCAGLDSLGIEYELNPHLVRGLDYYCHSAFEFTTEALGAQGAVVAGGRYDGLVETMGGPPTPGVGWAAGVERLAMLVGDVAAEGYTIAVVPVGADMEAAGFVLTQQLRDAGFRTDMAFRGNLSKRLKRANKLGAVSAPASSRKSAMPSCSRISNATELES